MNQRDQQSRLAGLLAGGLVLTGATFLGGGSEEKATSTRENASEEDESRKERAQESALSVAREGDS
ncbi:hypothetical protein [Salinibacter altiplanensis]|uniref:hypothetical protein n=1 Tax=Salinibacter altiplanensis TaxID=1803181 RepID=UPI000C9EF1F0|nr:hypothetical protein [Salinibacter altiplanensis]